jgi:hypothetical protein
MAHARSSAYRLNNDAEHHHVMVKHICVEITPSHWTYMTLAYLFRKQTMPKTGVFLVA